MHIIVMYKYSRKLVGF